MCRQQHAGQVAHLEQLLQAREADVQSLRALAGSKQQTAHALYPQDVLSLQTSLEMSAVPHRQQLEDEIGQLKRLHLLQVIRKTRLLLQDACM